jgi:Tfp pilus assembly protein PilE
VPARRLNEGVISMPSKGFTLIELVVLALLLGVIALVALA